MESAPYYLFAVVCWLLPLRNWRDPRFLLPFLKLFVPTTIYLAGLMLSSDYMLFWRPDDRIWFPFRVSYFNAYPNPLPKLSPASLIVFPLLMGIFITGPAAILPAWRHVAPRWVGLPMRVIEGLYGTGVGLVALLFTLSTLAGRLMDVPHPGSVILMVIFLALLMRTAKFTVTDALTDAYFANAGFGYLTEQLLRIVGRPVGRAIAR